MIDGHNGGGIFALDQAAAVSAVDRDNPDSRADQARRAYPPPQLSFIVVTQVGAWAPVDSSAVADCPPRSTRTNRVAPLGSQ